MAGFLIVFLGAGLGGALRHAVNLITLRTFGPDHPAGTFIVNLAGSVALGVIAGSLAARGHASHQLQLFLATGLLGGFTTFSAFSLEAALLWQRGQWLACALYVSGSVVLSIAGLLAGLAVVRTHPAV